MRKEAQARIKINKLLEPEGLTRNAVRQDKSPLRLREKAGESVRASQRSATSYRKATGDKWSNRKESGISEGWKETMKKWLDIVKRIL